MASKRRGATKRASGERSSSNAAAHRSSAHKAASGKMGAVNSRGRTTARKGSGPRTPAKKAKRGQQAIDPARAREIQEALIREHYLDGEPSGAWDGATQAAMQHYQEDQGWQSKTTPDSRALIKLGLGPSHEHLLNPESAMTMPAAPLSADSKTAKQAAPEESTPKQ
ncbi:MAG: peptidoglycan-binding domain-containing protein [Terriglobales bacterium]